VLGLVHVQRAEGREFQNIGAAALKLWAINRLSRNLGETVKQINSNCNARAKNENPRNK